MGDYYRYGITNDIYRVFDGANTVKEARRMVKAFIEQDKKEGFNIKYHIYLLDDRGHIKNWKDRLEV